MICFVDWNFCFVDMLICFIDTLICFVDMFHWLRLVWLICFIDWNFCFCWYVVMVCWYVLSICWYVYIDWDFCLVDILICFIDWENMFGWFFLLIETCFVDMFYWLKLLFCRHVVMFCLHVDMFCWFNDTHEWGRGLWGRHVESFLRWTVKHYLQFYVSMWRFQMKLCLYFHTSCYAQWTIVCFLLCYSLSVYTAAVPYPPGNVQLSPVSTDQMHVSFDHPVSWNYRHMLYRLKIVTQGDSWNQEKVN